MGRNLKILLKETKGMFFDPTQKQKESYGRLSHTLCAASLISAVSVTFSQETVAVLSAMKVLALMAWGVVLFWLGAILSKGE